METEIFELLSFYDSGFYDKGVYCIARLASLASKTEALVLSCKSDQKRVEE